MLLRSSVLPPFQGGTATPSWNPMKLRKSKSLPKSVKPREVCAVTTSSLQLFAKVDLQSVIKVCKWLSGGTFTSFYLPDLCPQADRIHKVGPLFSYSFPLERGDGCLEAPLDFKEFFLRTFKL